MKNLKKILVFLLSAFFLIVVLESCENSAKDVLQDEEFVNPFDFIGKIHNEGLDYIIKNVDFKKGKELIFEDVCKLASDFMLSDEKFNFMKYSNEQYKELGVRLASNYLDGKTYTSNTLLMEYGTQENEYLKKYRMPLQT